MPELDFHALRAAVEEVTTLPEFAAVQRRARRLRARSRLTVSAAMVATLAVMVPASVLAAQARTKQRPTVVNLNPAPTQVVEPVPVPLPSTPPQVSAVAAGGTSLDHVWLAVDVCLAGRCNLQLSEVTTERRSTGPARIGQLRDRPTDPLTDVRVVAYGSRAVVLTGRSPGGAQHYARLDPPASDPDGPVTIPRVRQAGTGDVVFQLQEYGEIRVADASTGRSSRLPTQPALQEKAVVTGISPGRGVWAIGRVGADLAVAASHDGGGTWRVRVVNAPAAGSSPVLVTADGRTAYLFGSTPAGLVQWRTTDGGDSWTALPARMPWPASVSGPFGAVARPDGSLLVWRNGPPAPVFLESTDGGRTYRPTTGPGGPVVALPDGYVALGERTGLSRDARTWAWVGIPYLPVTD